MASYQAKVEVIIAGLREVAALEGRLEAIQNAVTNLKKTPIDLNIGGRGKSRDLSGKLSKEVNDLVRNFNDFGKSISSVSKQAAGFGDLLSQTALKGTGAFDRQNVAVKSLATAYTTATAKAKQFQEQQNNLIRTSQGLQSTVKREIQQIKRRNKLQRGRAAQARAREATSNALIGGAFPLLFGQGLGASVGGASGGAAGGLLGGQFGFGLSLVGTAAGNAFDQLIQKAGDLSVAFETASGTSTALEAIIGRLDNSLKRRIDNLEKSGQAGAAADLAFQKLAKTIGVDNANALVTAGQDFQRIGKIIGEVATSSLALVLRLAQEVFNLEDRDPLKNVPEITPELRRARAEAAGDTKIQRLQEDAVKARLENDLKALDVIQRRLVLEKRDKELARIGAAALDGSLDKEIARNQIEQARSAATEQLLELDKKVTDQKERQARLDQTAVEQARRKQKIEADRTRREAERARRAAQRAQQLSRRQQVQGFNIDLQQLDVNSARVAANRGEEFGLVKQLDNLQAKQNLQISIARLTIEDTENLKNQEELIRGRIDLEQTILLTKIKQSIAQKRINELTLQTGTDFGQLSGTFRPVLALQDNVGFEAGAGLSGVVSQEVAVAKLTEKYKELGLAAQASADLVTFGVMEMVDGTKSAEEVFASFLRNIADMLLRTVSTMVAQYILLGTARLFATGSSLSSGPGGFDLGKNFFGGSPLGGLGFNNPIPRATGGPVGANQAYMVGERGPELFVPRGSGSIVPNNKMGSGVTVGSVNITVENTGERLDPAAQKQIASQVKGIVLATLSDERRSGGLL